MALLDISGLRVAYGEILALDGIDMTVEEGSAVAVLGANGAGKSTLLRTICGLTKPHAGSILFQGRSIAGASVHTIVRQGVLHVPEGRGLLPLLTVEENLQLGLYLQGSRDVAGGLDRAFGIFPILAQRRRQLAQVLSGGEQQMLAIARALICRPRLLMIDELSLGLAPLIVKELLALLREVHAGGVTLLLVEQAAHQVLRMVDRAYVLVNGRCVYGGPSDALRQGRRLADAYLGIDGAALPNANQV